MTRLTVILGDITQQDTEAIVNSAHPSLLGGGGVDGAIHAAAGSHLLDECRKLGPIETGQSVITNGYDLPAEYVLHTVGPIYGLKHGQESDLLAACYCSVLDLAALHLIRTISVPSISTGAYGYPINEAAVIALATVKSWIANHPEALDEIRFVLHSQSDFDLYSRLSV